jgi:hypothetical protein
MHLRIFFLSALCIGISSRYSPFSTLFEIASSVARLLTAFYCYIFIKRLPVTKSEFNSDFSEFSHFSPKDTQTNHLTPGTVIEL